jgi:hypothetical protein
VRYFALLLLEHLQPPADSFSGENMRDTRKSVHRSVLPQARAPRYDRNSDVRHVYSAVTVQIGAWIPEPLAWQTH